MMPAGRARAVESDRAGPPPPPPSRLLGSGFEPRLVLETGRWPTPPPERRGLQFDIDGEYQLRFWLQSHTPALRGTRRAELDTAEARTWLRVTPRAFIGKELELIAQADLFVDFDVRWLYAKWNAGRALDVSVGRQPLHVGMGLVFNDGNHPTLFGDYRGGDRADRLFATFRPGGPGSALEIGLGTELTLDEGRVQIADDELEVRQVASIALRRDDVSVAFYGRSLQASLGAGRSRREFLADVSGRFQAPIPGKDAYVFGEFEVAHVSGRVDQPLGPEEVTLSATGAAARVGAVATATRRAARWGRLVAQLEWGWTSSDSDPFDDELGGFAFDPNHNVGLVLFDQVLRWKTERAFADSDGAVFGATYLYPTVVFRPVPQLDLKAGAVLAQTTGDFVRPAAAGDPSFEGGFINYDGGDPRHRDLGLELDAGVEYRASFMPTLSLGAQGGVLFPGRAFADANGDVLDPQYTAIARFGILF